MQENKEHSRDHKRLGRELGLFTFSETVGKGLPLWLPKGATIRRELERFIVDEEIRRGYQHVRTPDIAKLDLYKKSGHYPYYKDSMYAPIQIDDEAFMLRPMTCPHHFELFQSVAPTISISITSQETNLRNSDTCSGEPTIPASKCIGTAILGLI